MASILQTIAEATRIRVKQSKAFVPLEVLQERCGRGHIAMTDTPFYRALHQPDMAFICEIKKASPSKGVIDPVFDYLKIAKDYYQAGADCISCLTEPKWFLGSDEIFTKVRSAVPTPMLRKDFTVDPYQIYQAKCMGADAVLLICAITDTPTLHSYLQLCEDLGLCALVEAHDESEVKSAVWAGASVIGVNNRNLHDFSVDLSNAVRLREQIPDGVLYVSESGVQTSADIVRLRQAGVDGVLIGETLMRADNKTRALQELRGQSNE